MFPASLGRPAHLLAWTSEASPGVVPRSRPVRSAPAFAVHHGARSARSDHQEVRLPGQGARPITKYSSRSCRVGCDGTRSPPGRQMSSWVERGLLRRRSLSRPDLQTDSRAALRSRWRHAEIPYQRGALLPVFLLPQADKGKSVPPRIFISPGGKARSASVVMTLVTMGTSRYGPGVGRPQHPLTLMRRLCGRVRPSKGVISPGIVVGKQPPPAGYISRPSASRWGYPSAGRLGSKVVSGATTYKGLP